MENNDKPTVRELLGKPGSDIKSFLGGIYEHSPWVAASLVERNKDDDNSFFASIETVSALAAAMKSIVDDSTREKKLELLRAHPDLCEKVSKLAELTEDSRQEQGGSGLQSLTSEERARFDEYNTQYRDRFGFPFILAVRNATKYTVLSALEGRVVISNNNTAAEREFATALEQVHKIAWMRLLSKVNYLKDCKGFLTCHVLDTANGCPARKMRIQLHRLSSSTALEEEAGRRREMIGEFVTNEDGRLEVGPALKGGGCGGGGDGGGIGDFRVGVYEWTFFVGDYFASMGTFTTGQPFLDIVPIRFGIDNPDEHYHVPLLVSPWSFSTYRGS